MAEWQTRWTQNPLFARMCGFKSHCRHWIYKSALRLRDTPSGMRFFIGGNMNSVETWHAETLGNSAVAALNRNGFSAQYYPTRQQVSAIMEQWLVKGASVGFGGSMTVRDLGIQERAAEAGCEILDHNAPGLEPDARKTILRRQLTCDLFISSSNAITLDGEIVNVDGTGNRVAALTFGPKKTVVIAGINKIVRNLDEAYARIETFASPMNNKRLDRANPCVKTGICMDCKLETRICRIYSVLRMRPSMSDFSVIIVGESLGY